MLSDSDFRFCLQQIEGYQRTRDKLPLFATIDGWLYPPRLNLEQCSSERTARYKAELLSAMKCQLSIVNCQLIDATGGYGVDTFFMSAEAIETHYFEQNTDLAAIAEHNFRLAGKNIVCHPVPFSLSSLSEAVSLLYLDPARRNEHGGKVFRLEDCTPNVIDIVRHVQLHCPNIRILLKLSPMLDFHQAIAQLGGAWDVHIVSLNNEVKELLLLSGGTGLIHAVALTHDATQTLSFTLEEEASAQPQYLTNVNCLLSNVNYIYEPDAAILKAGAFRLISARYGLQKADPNTHLYFPSPANPLIPSSTNPLIPGRLWQIIGIYARAKDLQRALACAGVSAANILTRNYVLSPDALHKNLRLKDGGDQYIIGCRIADKPLLLHCQRLN